MKQLKPCNRTVVRLSAMRKALCVTATAILMLTVMKQSGFAQTTALSFTQIPYSDPDLNRPGGGAEQWNDQNMSNIPIEGTSTRRLDKYFRFSWSMFESGQGVYTWTKFDQEINDAISKGQKFSFGIMTHYPDAVSPHRLNYDGGYSVYPQYLHNLMQAETVKDWKASNGSWVPNWNSEAYLSRLLALNQAINDHINTTSYNGVAYKDVINYIDIRGYGAFGEWHSYTIVDQMSQYPAGTRATTTSLNRIIDAHVNAFPNFPLVIMVSAFDGNRLGNTMNPPEVAYYALTRRNNYGPVGWRRDNWGATDSYLRSYTDQNTITVNGMRLDTAIMNRWKYAPVVGEPCCNADYADLENQVKRYHAVSFGNGNFSPNATINPNMRAASKAAGYRIVLEGGSIAASVSTGTAFPVTLQWKNVGLTQSYEDWDVLYELKNSAGTAVWSSVSAFKIKMFLPEATARAHTDNLTLPGSVAAGTYTLTVKVRDTDGFRSPMPLAITGRNSDGSYTLRSITVGTGTSTPNQAPVANAGANQTITLPTSTATLNGSASSDPDGTIASYQWSQVSGPSTSTLSSASTANITVSNLVQGTYTYQLKVTDNAGTSSTATVTVTVNAAANQAPVANAGSNQTITLPANTATLNGSSSRDADGTIASYLWAQISGPSASVLSSTSTASITVSSLVQGVYSYKLTVRDNSNATASDTVTVTVNAAPNQAPVANAGADQNITLPVSTATLNGSSSRDADGTIASYLWAQISGPSTSALSATNTASITVSNLVQGVYSYKLTVRDNSNATASDTVTVTVNAAPNQAPVANAGADQNITLPVSTATLNGSSSRDADGTIASYLWAQISGPSTSALSATNTASITVSNLVQGVYSYKLTVRDNSNATASDTVTVTVNAAANQAPIANAGANQTIKLPVNTATLNGSASSDPDGVISSYRWAQTSGPSASVLSSSATAIITVSGLQSGVYTYRLTVTDNNGATAIAYTTVTVDSVVNVPPAANAGADQSITLPVNSVTLNGSASSDANGTITGYLWKQVSGPAAATIAVNSAVTATVSNLQEGIYYFSLTVTDNNGATASDTVKVTVNAAANQAPVANAGSNQIITLPANSATLSGGASTDPDGTIASYSWVQVSGPSTSVISPAAAVSTTVSNLIAGVYTYRLTVTDNRGAQASATVTVTVNNNNTSVGNKPPVANAGSTQTIWLPASSATLNGSRSYDPDGRIVSYSWKQLSGPRKARISNSAAAITSATGLSRTGDYVFRLTVKDNNGAVASATVTITVRKSSYSGRGVSTAAIEEAEVAAMTPDSASVIAVTPESVQKLTDTGKASLYPNPAQDQVNLVVDHAYTGKVRIRVYNMSGEQVLGTTEVNKTAVRLSTTLQVNTLKAGAYTVELVFSASERKTLRFVKI